MVQKPCKEDISENYLTGEYITSSGNYEELYEKYLNNRSSILNYAFIFKLILVNVELKSDQIPMPALQYSKCVKDINACTDNGRVLCANYIEIYLNEIDLAVINSQYKWKAAACVEVEYSEKAYLPRWYTDYVFECFTAKTMLKGGDAVAYSLAKAKVNSL